MSRHDAGPLVALTLLAACIVLVGLAFARPTGATAGAPPGSVGVPPVIADAVPAAPPASGPAVARMPDGTEWTQEGPWSGSYAAWRAEAPRRVGRPDELIEAMRRHGVPGDDAVTLMWAVVTCEAPFYDLRMTSNGWRPIDGLILGADLRMEGDRDAHGRPRAHGWPQAREEWHAPLLLRHDVYSIDGGAAIVAAIREEAIRIGWAPLRPWSCVR